MFRLHCNKCYCHQKNITSLNFYISNCKHILCDRCVPGSAGNRKCPLCGVHFRPIPINPSMPDKVAYYFEDPSRFLELYRKISKFQADQRDSDDRGFQIKLRKRTEMKRKLESYLRMEAQVQQLKKRHSRSVHYDDTLSSEDCEGGIPKRRYTLPETPSTSSSEDFLSDEDNEKFLRYFEAALAANDKEPASWESDSSHDEVLDFDT